jgi:FtsP/CotA-like multicopper oxidase with cupredoxin domain
MFSSLSNLGIVIAYLSLPIWLVAVWLVGRVATRPTGRAMRRAVRVAGGVLVAGLLLVLIRLILFGWLAGFGWVFVSDRKLFTLLLLVIPAAFALNAVVRLIGIGRQAPADRETAVPAGLRTAAAAPLVVVSVQVTSVASVYAFFEKYFPPGRPFVLNLLVYGGILAAITALLFLRAKRQAVRIADAGGKPRATRRVWATRVGVTAVVVGLIGGLLTFSISSSKLPETHSMMQGEVDLGGGTPLTHAHGSAILGHTSVEDLAEPDVGEPDKRFTLTAQQSDVRLSSGRTVPAWTFNGQAPGPELRVREGELVEITLENRLPGPDGVTAHWHGVDVPNRADGVAGVTQDAVQPGETYTYRFRVRESGTRWYHSHQAGSVQVRRGLFGPLVLETAQPTRPVDEDIVIALHNWDLDGDAATDDDLVSAMNTADTLDRRRLSPGTKVRLRLVNSSHLLKEVTLTGTPFRVTALDGTDLVNPGEITDRKLAIGAADRYDLEFTMPATPVRLADTTAPDAGVLFSPDGSGDLAPKIDVPEFDPFSYGAASPVPFNAGSRFDRQFDVMLDEQYGFYDGKFVARMTVNGEVFPNAPMHMVKEGELIKMRFTNRGDNDHPMHVHGHHFLVLSRNGATPSGSPVWLDTVNVRPGEWFEIGFRADNPGIWMDHCHNFVHATKGMVLHLAYENVTTPFVVGGQAHNKPE